MMSRTSRPVRSSGSEVTSEPAVAYRGPKGSLLWTRSACYDCSGCVAVCPFHALEAHYGTIVADMDRCTLCTMCVRVCPTAAFVIDRRPPVAEGAPFSAPAVSGP